jgi:hypothetical protein
MNKKIPNYRKVNRTELNQRIDELVMVRDKIRNVFCTPVVEMSNERKMFVLQDLDEYESYLVRLIAKLKGVTDFSEN